MNEFSSFIQNLSATVGANAAAWNLPTQPVTDFQDAITAFGPVHNQVTNKENRTRQQMVAYQTARAELERNVRAFVQSFLVNNATIPLADRVGMELNPRGFTPRQPKGDITVAPVISLTALGGGKVRLRFKRPDSQGQGIDAARQHGHSLLLPLSAAGHCARAASASTACPCRPCRQPPCRQRPCR
jgi:hypothetical protein